MKCKKILQLLKIFALLSPTCVFAQNFKAIDFERLLKSNPLIRRYDPKTHRFKGTKSEPTPIQVLKKRQDKIINSIAELSTEKANILKESLLKKSSENFSWDKIANIDAKLKKLKKKKAQLIDAIALNGKTEVQTIRPIIQKVLSEVLNKKLRESRVLLNKLPRYRCSAPHLTNGLRLFLNTSERFKLLDYLQYSSLIALLFKHTDQTILFEREVRKK